MQAAFLRRRGLYAPAGFSDVRRMELSILGRSSSHFTRTVRMVAQELEIAYAFRPLADLASRAVHDYALNPALKIPILETPEGPWYGALNCCRELARRAPHKPQILWPEQLHERLAANAQELVLQGMSTEVALIMQGPTIDTASKAFESLTNCLGWLDAHWREVRTTRLSFLDITTYCFFTHLSFRQVADVGPYRVLQAFCDDFGARASAQATAYRFDFSS
jgi:glutathione S-transferase